MSSNGNDGHDGNDANDLSYENDDSTHSDYNSTCISCYSQTNLCIKSYNWLVTPRKKDIAKGLYSGDYMSTITIDICENCANKLKENHITSTIGWDFWDAIDNLLEQLPM